MLGTLLDIHHEDSSNRLSLGERASAELQSQYEASAVLVLYDEASNGDETRTLTEPSRRGLLKATLRCILLHLPLPIRLTNFTRPKTGQKVLPILPVSTLRTYNQCGTLRSVVCDFIDIICFARLASAIVCMLFS